MEFASATTELEPALTSLTDRFFGAITAAAHETGRGAKWDPVCRSGRCDRDGSRQRSNRQNRRIP